MRFLPYLILPITLFLELLPNYARDLINLNNYFHSCLKRSTVLQELTSQLLSSFLKL
jgi:hypothetical protein